MIFIGNTHPISSNKESLDSSVFSNKRKNTSQSSIDNKKKQPFLGPEKASSNCSIPTPVASATSSSTCHNIINSSETNTKEENSTSSTPVSMCCDEQDLGAMASSSSSSNVKKNNKMKGIEILKRLNK